MTNPALPYFVPSNPGNMESWSHDTSTIIWTSGQTYTITAQATDKAGNKASTSSIFTFLIQQEPAQSTVTLNLSKHIIEQNDHIDVTGRLSRLPEVNMDLFNLPVVLAIAPPSGETTTMTTNTNDISGNYTFSIDNVFTQKGAYILQANFAGTPWLRSSFSETKFVLVPVKGDIDGSGAADFKDAILALQIVSGITPSINVFEENDVNGDSNIGIEEAIFILQEMADMR